MPASATEPGPPPPLSERSAVGSMGTAHSPALPVRHKSCPRSPTALRPHPRKRARPLPVPSRSTARAGMASAGAFPAAWRALSSRSRRFKMLAIVPSPPPQATTSYVPRSSTSRTATAASSREQQMKQFAWPTSRANLFSTARQTPFAFLLRRTATRPWMGPCRPAHSSGPTCGTCGGRSTSRSSSGGTSHPSARHALHAGGRRQPQAAEALRPRGWRPSTESPAKLPSARAAVRSAAGRP
mmetsp:Transcript_100314/g.323703  ORF Transcript_100314/g.323703 Transcript_100314/m.323703 type:complete len:241 (+) Transcript_100314:1234-1956(+)